MTTRGVFDSITRLTGTYTFANLPPANQIPHFPPGTTAYTSDAGLCTWSGYTWTPVSAAQAVTVAPTGDSSGVQDTAAITAAANALTNGGVVSLVPGTYYIKAPLPMVNGVQYVGTAPRLNYSTLTAPIPDSNLVIANGGGTILQAASGYSGA